jgi:hypothetical protein
MPPLPEPSRRHNVSYRLPDVNMKYCDINMCPGPGCRADLLSTMVKGARHFSEGSAVQQVAAIYVRMFRGRDSRTAGHFALPKGAAAHGFSYVARRRIIPGR